MQIVYWFINNVYVKHDYKHSLLREMRDTYWTLV